MANPILILDLGMAFSCSTINIYLPSSETVFPFIRTMYTELVATKKRTGSKFRWRLMTGIDALSAVCAKLAFSQDSENFSTIKELLGGIVIIDLKLYYRAIVLKKKNSMVLVQRQAGISIE